MFVRSTKNERVGAVLNIFNWVRIFWKYHFAVESWSQLNSASR